MGIKTISVQRLVGLGALVSLVGCGQMQQVAQQEVPPVADTQLIATTTKDDWLSDKSELLAQLAAWFEEKLGPMTWEEYAYHSPRTIEGLEITAKIRDEGKDHYEVRVITKRAVTPVQQTEGVGQMLYLHDREEVDAIRLEETYWMTHDYKTQQVYPMAQAQVCYKRLPYDPQVMMPDRLWAALGELLMQPPDFFEGYQALVGQPEAQQRYLRQGCLDPDAFYLEADQLMQRYPVAMSPYTLGESLAMNWKECEVQVSDYATEKQARYHISVPVSLLLNHYKKVYYRYNYFVGTEEGQIEWIRLERVVQEQPID